MENIKVSVELTPELHAYLHESAQHTGRTIETLVAEAAGLLTGPFFPALEALDTFSDEKLWAVVHLRLPSDH